MVNQTHDNNNSGIKRWRLKKDINLTKFEIINNQIMNEKRYEKKNARRICTILDGLGFSCKVLLKKRAFFSLRSNEYIILTNAPRPIFKDVIQGMGY
jgi:hypothetical protein